MWSLLVAFLNLAMVQVIRAAVIKFVIFSAIVLAVAGLAVFVFNALVNFDILGLNNMLAALPDGLLFFLAVFQFHIGLPVIFGALIARFTIRRIPLIG